MVHTLGGKPDVEDTPDTPKYVRCDMCNSDDYTVYLEERQMRPLADSEFTVFGEQGEHPRLVKCNTCGLIYANPRDSREGLLDKYKALPIKEYLLEERSRRITAARDARLLQRYVAKGRVLDVGCSAGIFLDSLGDSFERYGIEPGSAGATVAKKSIGETFIHNGTLETVNFPAGFFDAVTMWDVLEHLVNPRQALEKVSFLLKDNGYLLLTTPNIDSVFARVLGRCWPHLIRSHIYYFTPRTLEAMLNKCGFETVYRSTYSRKFTLRYLFERVGLIPSGRSESKDSTSSGRSLSPWNIIIPINFHDTFVVVARKVRVVNPQSDSGHLERAGEALPKVQLR